MIRAVAFMISILQFARSRRAALTAALAIALAGCSEKHPELVTPPPPVVMVAVPVQRTVTNYQLFTVRTEAVESVDIKARVTGYLKEILFKDGADVNAGDVLFKIDDRPYKAALDEAKANVAYAKAALVEAEANYQIGMNVRKANPAAISEQEINQRLGARDEAAASVLQAEASVESAQLNFDWCTVAAPIAGRINRHFVDAGNLVSQDVTSLTNIVTIKPIWAYFDVDQNTALDVEKLIAEGKVQSARDTTIDVGLSLGEGDDFPIAGTIDFVSNQLDPNTGSLRVRAVFPNQNGFIGSGMFGRVRVPIGPPHDALLVLDQAVGTNQGQKYLMVVNEKNQVEYRAVEVGQIHDGLREVLQYREIMLPGANGADTSKREEVLKPTDRIIIQGLQRVRPGADVTPKQVDMLTQLNVPAPGTVAPGEAKPADEKEAAAAEKPADPNATKTAPATE
ncbi:MAG: efflux RND transporter periplasmic adaptor subunit [Pirellulales bacterium]